MKVKVKTSAGVELDIVVDERLAEGGPPRYGKTTDGKYYDRREHRFLTSLDRADNAAETQTASSPRRSAASSVQRPRITADQMVAHSDVNAHAWG